MTDTLPLPSDLERVPAEDVLNVKIKPSAAGSDGEDVRVLHVQRVYHEKDGKLRLAAAQYKGSVQDCRKWADILDTRRKATACTEKWGPRNFVVFINPASGTCKSLSIYHKKVEPIFAACDVTASVIGNYVLVAVTSQAGEAVDKLQAMDLSGLEGVIVVGGDGFHNECINGLLLRAITDAGQDVSDPKVEVAESPLPLGVIPTGTGNWCAEIFHGNNDVETATINILKGQTKHVNVIGLHMTDMAVRFSGGVCHFGFTADIIHESEKHRWMGVKRYTFSSALKLCAKRLASLQMEMHVTSGGSDIAQCATQDNARDPSPIRAKVLNIGMFPLHRLSERGALLASLDHHHVTTLITMGGPCSDVLRHFTRMKNKTEGIDDFDFVEYRKLTSLSAKLDSEGARKQVWYFNCDGEPVALTGDTFLIRFYPGVLRAFVRSN